MKDRMVTKQELDVIIARLNGLASEAEMRRIWAKEKCRIPQEYRYMGERAGLLRALDMLQGREVVKEEPMGNGCE